MNRRDRRAGLKEGRAAAAAAGQASPAGALLAEAFQAMQRGNLGLAEGICRDAIVREPKNAAGHYLLGSIAMQGGRPDLAIEPLRKACALDGRNGPYHNELGLALQAAGKLDEAVASYRRAIALEPQNGRGYNNLAVALEAQGKRAEASAQYAKALERNPEAVENYADAYATVARLAPEIDRAVSRAAQGWPERQPIEALFDAGGFAATSDPLFLRMLVSSTVRTVALERLLASLRLALLKSAAGGAATDVRELEFRCALARQCFINEYVFATLPEEMATAGALKASLEQALAGKTPVAAQTVAAVASYFPLMSVANAATLLDRKVYAAWPAPLEAVLTLQLREPIEENLLREKISALTPIEDATSLGVQAQYEENPYPRWLLTPPRPNPTTIDKFLASQFPHVPLPSVNAGAGGEILVAGCGTGLHAIKIAQEFPDAQVLALDLSRSSLAYALRKSRELKIANVSYAQADILTLGSIGRSFDFIDCAGVLHHLADPEAGWRVLLSLLRPSGVMRIGLYSELARRDIVAARAFIAERGFPATAEGIRAARAAIADSELRTVTRFNDFYATSECRDLLFHVQEQRFTIARIRAFLEANELRFIGFEAPPAVLAAYARRFPDDWTLRDLAYWEQFENELPAIFQGMYQFCVARR